MCVLDSVASGYVGPTQMMYHANLSWRLLKGWVALAIAQNLLVETEVGKRRTYALTEKGHMALYLFEELNKVLGLAIELNAPPEPSPQPVTALIEAESKVA